MTRDWVDHQGVFIIAELSANHGGDIAIALQTIQAAKEAGADGIKLQTYTPDTITMDVKSDLFKVEKGSIWEGKYLYDLYQEAYTPWEWHAELFAAARNEGLVCFSSPFDKSAVDLLETLDTPAYKIASFEINDIPLIRYAAEKGKPMIISTGIATEEDIRSALEACREVGNEDITLLKCTSSYPAPVERANMLTMQDFGKRFQVKYGLSDHTLGEEVPVVATALGASMIEKHFIIDKKIGGPDASFSLDVQEFKSMVKAVRKAEKALGSLTYELDPKTIKSRAYRRSLFAAKDIEAGESFSQENVKSIRPGNGLEPKHWDQVLTMKSKVFIPKGTPLSFEMMT